MRLLNKMPEGGMIANVISSSAVISACEKGEQWKQASTLLHRIRKKGMAADAISISTAISAGEKGRQS